VRLENGARILGEIAPASTLAIAPGATPQLGRGNAYQGFPEALLVIDNGNTIRVDNGLLRFEEGIQWQSARSISTLETASPGSVLLFAAPLEIPVNLTTVVKGAGTNLLAAGATSAGGAQLGAVGPPPGFTPGYLEVAGPVSARGRSACWVRRTDQPGEME
jgi:hypothetical protein